MSVAKIVNVSHIHDYSVSAVIRPFVLNPSHRQVREYSSVACIRDSRLPIVYGWVICSRLRPPPPITRDCTLFIVLTTLSYQPSRIKSADRRRCPPRQAHAHPRSHSLTGGRRRIRSAAGSRKSSDAGRAKQPTGPMNMRTTVRLEQTVLFQQERVHREWTAEAR